MTISRDLGCSMKPTQAWRANTSELIEVETRLHDLMYEIWVLFNATLYCQGIGNIGHIWNLSLEVLKWYNLVQEKEGK